ncbi:VanZ family protein [Alkalicoccus chagannorensis]|uniref:VanZ family protein n=1 Tax=Alkalicoccus chagannorensis TaxID=427072 RepID=UPI001FDF750D|nr:VanZ family protein [Alkalicoccus chagannorensis]
MHALKQSRARRPGWTALIICVVYAASDEYHQTFIPGRSGEVSDVVIDGIGAFVGISFYLLIRKRWSSGA